MAEVPYGVKRPWQTGRNVAHIGERVVVGVFVAVGDDACGRLRDGEVTRPVVRPFEDRCVKAAARFHFSGETPRGKLSPH
jgi:hypothetical protein